MIICVHLLSIEGRIFFCTTRPHEERKCSKIETTPITLCQISGHDLGRQEKKLKVSVELSKDEDFSSPQNYSGNLRPHRIRGIF